MVPPLPVSIPLMILNALRGKTRRRYMATGSKSVSRLYVEDHAFAAKIWRPPKVGETYNIGGRYNERKNLMLWKPMVSVGRTYSEQAARRAYRLLIHLGRVDRPGHDLRCAIDASKIARELGWLLQETFESGNA